MTQKRTDMTQPPPKPLSSAPLAELVRDFAAGLTDSAETGPGEISEPPGNEPVRSAAESPLEIPAAVRKDFELGLAENAGDCGCGCGGHGHDHTCGAPSAGSGHCGGCSHGR